jgi:superoxide dismutase, Cu-Zn family
MEKKKLQILAVVTAAFIAAVAPALAQQPLALHQAGNTTAPAVARAVAVLHPTAGNQATGTVTFTQEGQVVKVVAEVTGLKPNAKHGFHVHELGDCSALDASSAGGHFNPMSMPHGAPGDMKHHGGDLGNLQADAQGKAHIELTLADVTLGAGAMGILGRGVIVHLMEDDLKTQPTGNSGARIACGTIGLAKDGVAK